MRSSTVPSSRILSSPHASREHDPHVCNVGVAEKIGAYSDAVEVAPNLRWLMTSGTPGLSKGGSIPDTIVAQAELAWRHITAILTQARMTPADIVKVTQYLTPRRRPSLRNRPFKIPRRG